MSPELYLGRPKLARGAKYSSGIANRVSRNSSGTESLAPRSKLWLQTSDPRSTDAGLPWLAIFADYFTKTCSDNAEGFESRRPRLISEVYIAIQTLECSCPPDPVGMEGEYAIFQTGPHRVAGHGRDLPSFALVLRAVLCHSTWSCATERVFSIMNDTFTEDHCCHGRRRVDGPSYELDGGRRLIYKIDGSNYK